MHWIRVLFSAPVIPTIPTPSIQWVILHSTSKISI
jgi:hypothetical protein